jgi:flavin-dependent dehydrogenase
LRADVAIVGAGPAGSAVALELVRLGRSVVVVTRDDPRVARTFGECLPPAAALALGRLQLPAPDPQHHLPSFGNVSSWGRADTGSNDFIFSPYGHGWHLDRARFDASLQESMEGRGVTILTGTAGQRITRNQDGGWVIPLAGSSVPVLAARWLIDCSGRGAHVASRMNARIEGADRLVAFAAMALSETDRDSDCSTLTEAAPDGWWYSARLTNSRRVVAFHTDGDLPVCQAARGHQGFLRLLEQTRHVKVRMAGYVVPKHFPVPLAAGGRWLKKAFGEGWVAVGDAAQAYDPLSSQGLTFALESGLRAAFAVSAAIDGDYRHLERYQMMLEIQRARYERLRCQFYGLERRWPESMFWLRRLPRSDRSDSRAQGVTARPQS